MGVGMQPEHTFMSPPVSAGRPYWLSAWGPQGAPQMLWDLLTTGDHLGNPQASSNVSASLE